MSSILLVLIHSLGICCRGINVIFNVDQQAGLSMALGAFLAGLLLAETEFSLQVESDIAPYRGLLLGLFFMTVGLHLHIQKYISCHSVLFDHLPSFGLAFVLFVILSSNEISFLNRYSSPDAAICGTLT